MRPSLLFLVGLGATAAAGERVTHELGDLTVRIVGPAEERLLQVSPVIACAGVTEAQLVAHQPLLRDAVVLRLAALTPAAVAAEDGPARVAAAVSGGVDAVLGPGVCALAPSEG